jgi:SulP family sulfate permease
LRKRIEAVKAALPKLNVRPAHALRETIGQGYTPRDFRRDAIAGIIVGVVALPLSMALAIATGVPPQYGLYTAIIAGAVIALLGGSRVQVSGPTAAFVVILAPITAQYGLAGLAMATVMAGVMLVAMGALRMGQLIQFIPYPVTTGFTAGIAIVIATLQLRDFLGLDVEHMPEHYAGKVMALLSALPTLNWPDLVIGAGALAILLLWPKFVRRIPAALVALPVAAIAAVLMTQLFDGVEIATVASRFTYEVGGEVRHGIPQVPPTPLLPWTLPGPGGAPLEFSFEMVRALAISAFAIAMLGAIESLLSMVVADGMTGQTSEPNAELLAQGVGNIAAPFFGGFAATGAIARTATNVRAGGRSPVAAIVHAGFVLAAVLALAPLLGYLPMASLAALLLIVARNMAEVKHVVYVLRFAPRSDAAVMLTCLGLTVIFDMVIAVSAGVVLAAVLFMRRMAEVSNVKLIGEQHPDRNEVLPKGVLLYEIAGPLFFGAAQKAMSSLHTIGNGVKLVILDMESVPAMDATGLVNLLSTIRRLRGDGVGIILGGVQPQPMRVLRKANVEELDARIGICQTLDEAITMARFQTALGEDLHEPKTAGAAAHH